MKDRKEDEENQGRSEDETEDGHTSDTNCDQDSHISFMNNTDEEIDTADTEEEDWIEYMKRSTEEAMERMKTAKNKCWIKTHRRMKWRIAMRLASLPDERWVVKAAGWNPELSTKNKTYRAVEDQKENGKTRLTNSSSLKKLFGSKRQQTVKDGKQWKVNTQRQLPNTPTGYEPNELTTGEIATIPTFSGSSLEDVYQLYDVQRIWRTRSTSSNY